MAILLGPAVVIAAAWFSLPEDNLSGRCSLAGRITPTESDAVAFSTALRSAILDNPGGPFRLRTTDAALTSYVVLNTQGRQLADPQVRFLNGSVCLSGRIVGLGLLAPRFRIEARPYIADGNLQFDIRYLVMNGRVLPDWVRHLVQRIANESIQDARFPVRLDTVQVRDGELEIRGERLASIGD